MLLINQRLNKLAAARSHFEACGMLRGSLLSSVIAATTMAAEGFTEPTQMTSGSFDNQAPTPTALENFGEIFTSTLDSGNPSEGSRGDTSGVLVADAEGSWSIVEGPRVHAVVRLAQNNSTW